MMTKGDRFIHSRVLDENNRPAVCTVSKIAQGVIYYRVGDEKKSRNFFPIEETGRWVKEWLK